MGISRNSIDISGITPEKELPSKIEGQVIEYSEVDYIFIPEDKPRVHNIHHLSIHIDLLSNRIIHAPLGTLIVVDGIKKIRLVYIQREHSEKKYSINLQLPYNTFFELPKSNGDITGINVYIADAFFQIIESRKIYSHILYIVNVHYENPNQLQDSEKHTINLSDEAKEINFTVSSIFDSDIDSDDTEPVLLSRQALNEVTISSTSDLDASSTEEYLVDTDEEYL